MTGPESPTAPPAWLIEVLHVVWGFARREHERYVLTPRHAAEALALVPADVLRAARVDWREDADV